MVCILITYHANGVGSIPGGKLTKSVFGWYDRPIGQILWLPLHLWVIWNWIIQSWEDTILWRGCKGVVPMSRSLYTYVHVSCNQFCKSRVITPDCSQLAPANFLTSKKNCHKLGKRGKKLGKRGKIGKVLSLYPSCPSWQIGLATLLLGWSTSCTLTTNPIVHLLHLIHIHKLMVTIHWSIPTSLIKNKFSYFKKYGISSYFPILPFPTSSSLETIVQSHVIFLLRATGSCLVLL